MAFPKGNKYAVGNKNNLGKKFSAETCEKIRQARLGTKLSAETRKKMGISRMGNHNNPGHFGEKSHTWKGGMFDYWKNKCLQRDEWSCRQCGYSEEEIMEVDHILNKKMYPELYLDINNLQTLCPNCHRRKTNQDKKMITKYLNNNA